MIKRPTETDNYTMNAYQADMAQTAIYRDKIIYPALGLVNEAGEVAGKIKKIMRDEQVSVEGFVLTDKQRAAVAAELGDVLWYIAALAKDLNVSLNEVAKMNIDKLIDRKDRGVIGGSGDDR